MPVPCDQAEPVGRGNPDRMCITYDELRSASSSQLSDWIGSDLVRSATAQALLMVRRGQATGVGRGSLAALIVNDLVPAEKIRQQTKDVPATNARFETLWEGVQAAVRQQQRAKESEPLPGDTLEERARNAALRAARRQRDDLPPKDQDTSGQTEGKAAAKGKDKSRRKTSSVDADSDTGKRPGRLIAEPAGDELGRGQGGPRIDPQVASAAPTAGAGAAVSGNGTADQGDGEGGGLEDAGTVIIALVAAAVLGKILLDTIS